MTYKLALVGRDIAHSKSQSIYEKILNEKVNYSLLDYSEDKEIPGLAKLFDEGLDGLSITAPYKSHFIDQVTIESDIIKKLGIINCVKKTLAGFFATNTDYLAVENILGHAVNKDTPIVILGDGKMASVCIEILNRDNLTYTQFSRQKNGNIETLDFSKLSKPFIINTCSRGYTFQGKISKSGIFWDMNYSHEKHESYISKQCQYIDGLELLMLQGRHAIDFWSLSKR